MSLNGALQVGQSALLSSQVGLQNAGHNMANAATEGYSRRTVHLAALPDEPLGRGISVGRGVQVFDIRREVDTALQARLRDAISQENAALAGQGFLASLESLQNELTDNDLSSLLSSFFNSFSELANNPQDTAIRSLVVQEGQNLANRIATLHGDYGVLQEQTGAALSDAVVRVNQLLDQIGAINLQIAQTEAGVGEAAALRDRRDALIDELAGYVEVSVVEQTSGVADVFIGSTPVVLAGQSRGMELRTETIDGAIEVSLRVRDDGTNLTVNSGRLGGILRERESAINGAIDTLDTFTEQLIFEVNRLHAQGQGQVGRGSVEGEFTIADSTANLNAVAAGLPFRIENGSFFVHLTHLGSGTRTAHQITVDGDAMSLDDLIGQINAEFGPGSLTASKGPGNRLQLDAPPGFEISFSDDSSGALAALGVNTFFSGSGPGDIEVNALLRDNPELLERGRRSRRRIQRHRPGHRAAPGAEALLARRQQPSGVLAERGEPARDHDERRERFDRGNRVGPRVALGADAVRLRRVAGRGGNRPAHVPAPVPGRRSVHPGHRRDHSDLAVHFPLRHR